MGKFPALRKAMFIHRTHLIFQEMTGDGIDDHLSLHAVLDIFFPECCFFNPEMVGYSFGFFGGDIYHQRFATCPTFCAINQGADLFIQAKNNFINGISIHIGEELPESIIFIFPAGSQ